MPSVGIVQGFIIAFGVANVAFAAFWLNEARALRRDGSVPPELRTLLLTRILTYAVIGVSFALGALYRSEWLLWVGIAAMATKIVVESLLRRRLRAATNSSNPA